MGRPRARRRMIELFKGTYTGVSVRHLPGGKTVRLLERIILPDGTTIPAGFICDLDSVARELGPLYTWLKGRTVLGAIVHDYCYRHHRPRKQSDQLFKQVMAWEQVRRRYRLPIYWAVRGFGWFFVYE
ncbi:DUF1353 domain-containing protein [Gilvimarinus agarilyticus]|uniref:DUF1353 domain-containing protein n=1 Tax=Gilvimarinus agarilyticus TaxID=679259 RepID=UPI0018DB196A|nr:DUF1353 domain-containing protein [Gilvimarinus agarilyticus]